MEYRSKNSIKLKNKNHYEGDVCEIFIGSDPQRRAYYEIEINPRGDVFLAKVTYGGTDTSSIQMTGSGAKVGALSIPTRYIHSAVETADLGDAEACVALSEAFIEAV